MLDVLDIGNKRMRDVFLCRLESISTPRVLVQHSDKFHGQICCPVSNGTWKMLQIIDLSSINFSGTLPEDVLTSWEAMRVNVHFDNLQYQLLRFSKLYCHERVLLLKV